MYLADHARTRPDKPAVISADTGRYVTFRQLNEESTRLARLLQSRGLERGDHFAVLMENNLHFHASAWAAFRSGVYITAVNCHLPAEDAAYVVGDSKAKCLIVSYQLRETAVALADLIPDCPIRLMVGGVIPGWESYEDVLAGQSAEPLADEWAGDSMLYSSGTTGRPKGILRPLPPTTAAEAFTARQGRNQFRLDSETIYLSPAPLYHSAPFSTTLNVQAYGGTVVMMEKFDAEQSLRLIEQYKVTHSQWVPTMFVRMLKMPQERRTAYDLSSHRLAIHAAAPCPIEVKRQMIDWWGSIVFEYYGASERIGGAEITAEEWLKRPGSVGRPNQVPLHICDESGEELPRGETGLIYFQRDTPSFEYFNDPGKTRSTQNPRCPTWYTVGDMGFVDEEGYLFLTDRQSFMIISGGVNIYPQAIEDALILHPKVSDVAVFGIPDEDMGEAVKAVVELAPGVPASDDLKGELLGYARQRLAHYMAPRSIDFIEQMPRLPSGKLYKRLLREPYWQGHDMRRSAGAARPNA